MQINNCNTACKRKQGEKSHYHLNRCKKAFDKIQHVFLVKALMELGIDGMYLNIIIIEGMYST
jgi:hypothetical protein